MYIAFFVPSSGSFYKKIQEVSSFDEKVDLCVENVDEFCAVIKKFHELRGYTLDPNLCVVGIFAENLYNYIQSVRKTPRLFRKVFIDLCEKIPQGFGDCFKIVKSYRQILWDL